MFKLNQMMWLRFIYSLIFIISASCLEDKLDNIRDSKINKLNLNETWFENVSGILTKCNSKGKHE